MARKLDPTKIHFDENTVVEDVDLDEEEIYVEGNASLKSAPKRWRQKCWPRCSP
jgi:hypothetical protein